MAHHDDGFHQARLSGFERTASDEDYHPLADGEYHPRYEKAHDVISEPLRDMGCRLSTRQVDQLLDERLATEQADS